MKKQIYLSVLLTLISFPIFSQSKVEIVNVECTSLDNCIIENLNQQSIAVYLPPAYSETSKRFPVIYFLPGFGDDVKQWIDGTYFSVKEVMDDLIINKVIDETIFVICNGKNLLGGSFYVNSEVTGNWEDYIVKDIVNYIDLHYKTLDSQKSRVITGHSMGGFGALNIAMKHPSVFGTVYALSPGLWDLEGLKNCQLFKSNDFIVQNISQQTEWKKSNPKEFPELLEKYISHCYSINDWDAIFSCAYSMAFSPNRQQLPYVKYPYCLKDNVLVEDKILIHNYENGYGNLNNKVKLYKDSLTLLNGIYFEYGINDEYQWIPQGCEYFDSVLNNYQIPHQSIQFEGYHQNIVGKRLKEQAIPTLAKHLEYVRK